MLNATIWTDTPIAIHAAPSLHELRWAAIILLPYSHDLSFFHLTFVMTVKRGENVSAIYRSVQVRRTWTLVPSPCCADNRSDS